MRILYNAIPLMPPRTGVGRYVEQLCRAIVLEDPAVRCDFLFTLAIQHGLRPAGGEEPSRRRSSSSSRLFFQRLVFTPPFTRVYPRVMDLLFRARTLRAAYDVYHETNFVPRPFAGPTVVTVYDLSLVLHPETHPAARVAIFERDFARRIPWVDRFLAISRSVKEDFVRLFGVDPDRVAVTTPGVDAQLFHPRVGAPARSAEREVPERYVLFVGSLEPRKNLGTVFEAYSRLDAATRRAHPIVLAGPSGWKFAPVRRRAAELGLDSQLIWLGFVTDERLAELYRGATAVVFPSVYEGFGLPLLEAMASGAPVVCSDIPSSVEVAAEAALRVAANDVDAWTAALRRLLGDARLRGDLRSAGLERAAAFTWRRCARETLAVYRELAA